MTAKEMINEMEDFIGNKSLVIESLKNITTPSFSDEDCERLYSFIVDFTANQFYHARLGMTMNNHVDKSRRIIEGFYSSFKERKEIFIYQVILEDEQFSKSIVKFENID